jgi:transcriptional regulator of acetoin/glycerol metabolism
MQKTVYRVRTQEHIINRIALDMLRDARKQERQQTQTTLHCARAGSQPISIDVRVLAATNRDLEAAASAGTFRQDLFYRLNVFPIRIPSLRAER